MARIELSSLATGVVVNTTNQLVAGASVRVYVTGTTTAVTVYNDANSSTLLAQPLITDSSGRIPGYLDGQQTVDLVVTVGTTTFPAVQTEVLRGDQTPSLDGSGRLVVSQLAAHASTHATGGSDPVSPASIGAATAAQVANALVAANNLSDVQSVAGARGNLGLGSAATHLATDFLLAANLLTDLSDPDAARGNLMVPVLRSVQTVATANLSLTGLQTVDSYPLVDGDRVLLTGQTTGSQNGPWIVHSGSWTRPTDYLAGSTFRARMVQVNGGTVNAGSLWTVASTTLITVDSTASAWAKVTGGSTTAGVVSFAGRTGTVAPVHGDYSYKTRTTHTYAIQGALAVAAGPADTAYLPPFFVSAGANETVQLVKARGVIGGGTGVNATLQQNGSNIVGFTNMAITASPTSVTPTAVTVAEDDQIGVILSSLAGSPVNLSLTVVLEHTIT